MMNDQLIDELLFRCGISQHRYCDPKHPDLDGYIVSDQKLENLIGAVVEQCIQACLNEGAKWRGEQDITEFKLSAQAIKEHFSEVDDVWQNLLKK